ncbi:MAG: hypothetical protein ACO3YP_12720, partial [bacterium]
MREASAEAVISDNTAFKRSSCVFASNALLRESEYATCFGLDLCSTAAFSFIRNCAGNISAGGSGIGSRGMRRAAAAAVLTSSEIDRLASSSAFFCVVDAISGLDKDSGGGTGLEGVE